jgi:hypothetical protein
MNNVQSITILKNLYYPAVTVGTNNGWTLNTSNTYSIPSGFTFLNTIAFDPSHIGSNCSLANTNHSISSTSNQSGITNYKIISGTKVMFSATLLNTNGTGDNIFIGIVRQTFNVSYHIGFDPASPSGYGAGFGDDGSFAYHGTITAEQFLGYPNFTTAGSLVDVAVDTVNKKMWYRVNGGNWNNNASYDPGTNTGGLDISVLTGL